MKRLKLIKVFTYINGVITVLLGLMYVFKRFMLFKLLEISNDNASSIAVIGGADGPTTIFLTTTQGGISLEILILIFGVITTVLFLLAKNIKKE
ncbi:Na+-transporting methylmalonyl-CoA/oxaloacetate decarboxylase beta subunit [Sedimentibacter acidaminivorans]|jgi:Na+-transporting methylmalonyl-CoA/oxaloacetate decarboxylase beta subunit|uniref:Na+-transporting methylmalonyl-CoA/oxaloacetate decarboxylase beta subunit n=1 Tax=Sedimentibacter acidaminivorans TaxID=913099 RepID=A0ABS4GG59_9FIRM|nr:sodium ion-translocating decarboxylase subunit beta [Sedimentibacter acidaminivorans]MBP1926673.1 Na+-transporting methylmalonyl-CoA/oxaloacetate decarboxylase beta subunit [Sedimentibacter acidaminivorans]